MNEQQLIEKLTDAGHRVTTQRLLVWRALEGTDVHPSASNIHQQLVSEHPAMGLATVYNTLELFEELGVVRTLTVDGVTHYDVGQTPHVNLICERCGRVIDVVDLDIAGWQRDVASRSGFEVAGRNVDFYGLCPECQRTSGATTE